MSIEALSGSISHSPAVMQKPQITEELTTVTTYCSKKHQHEQSCPHTVSTRPAPKMGEPGYLLDEKV